MSDKVKKVGVFIPARLESKRLPNKLVLPMGDSCLFEIACRKLNRLLPPTNKYVLVNDDVFMDIANRYNNIQVVERSKESAEAETPLSFIFAAMKQVPDTHLMFLNPCLAFLKPETIERSLELFRKSGTDYATSVKPLQNWIFTSQGLPLNEIDYKELTTKKIKPIYQAAHCFHIFDKEQFFKDGYMLKEGLLPIPVPPEETIDIDTEADYEYARWKYEKEISD